MGRTSDARERLVQAAIDLLWQQGFGAISVESICERAGVRKGSFYHFFKSKEELVMVALDTHWENRRPSLDRLFSPTVPPLERLRGYFRSVFERQSAVRGRYGHTLGCFYTSIGIECCEQYPEITRKVKTILGHYESYYRSALRDLDAEGVVRVPDVNATAKSLFAYMEGVLGQARIGDDLDAIRNLEASAMHFLGIEVPRTAAQRRDD